jgi:hypothetical protein
MEQNKNHKSEQELPIKPTQDGHSKKETDPNNPTAKKGNSTDVKVNKTTTDELSKTSFPEIDDVEPTSEKGQSKNLSESNPSDNIAFSTKKN